MGFAEQMISSIKRNSRRKAVHIPFIKNKHIRGTGGDSYQSKELKPKYKNKLLFKLKKNRKKEERLRLKKIFISFILTLFVIILIVSVLKFIFF
jgi:hypothetical protein